MGEQPRPRSPMGNEDLNENGRQQAKLQVLENEISFLQEELRLLEDVQPTSRCCKELDEFLSTKPDPLIFVNQQSTKPDCSWTIIRRCCGSNDAHRQQVKKNGCCCFSNRQCCPKCSGFKDCSCFHQKCFSFKRSNNCCKFKLCPCAVSCCGSC